MTRVRDTLAGMFRTLASRLGRPSPRALDVAVAALVALPVLGSSFTSAQAKDEPAVGVLGLLVVAPLLFRRRRPVGTLAAVLIAGAAVPGSATFLVAALVALYTVACARRPAVIAAAALAVVASTSLHRAIWEHVEGGGELVSPVIACGVAASLGLYAASHRARLGLLTERAERLERERELLAERAVAEERVRIAQELHDVVAHNVSLIVVQAQALAATANDADVTAATDDIADLGRQAMGDMHRTLKLLRADESDAQRAPQPTLANVDALLDQARRAGMRVDLVVSGSPHELPAVMDLSAYRIVQEALTNVVRHAGPVTAHILLDYRPDALVMTITNERQRDREASPVTNGSGNGLIGMRERVALFGGTLHVDTTDPRCFSVRAAFPNTPATR